MLPVTPPDGAIPAGHPLRRMKDVAAQKMAPIRPLLVTMAATWTVAPPLDQGLLAMLLMALYGIQSESELCDEIRRNQPFRWFLGLTPDGPRIEALPLAQMRSRLLRNSAAREFLDQTIEAARAAGLLADPQFAPDAQQITAWASPGASVTP